MAACGEVSPVPSLEGPGVGQALQLTPSIWVRTGSLSGFTSEGARNAGCGLSSSQSARAPWRPEPGTGCRRAKGFPGPLRPVQRQRRRQPLSHPTKCKPGRPGADPAKPPQSALPTGATSPCCLGLAPGVAGWGAVSWRPKRGGVPCRRRPAFLALSAAWETGGRLAAGAGPGISEQPSAPPRPEEPRAV